MDKKSGGFTLVELIVLIAILGIIAAIAVPSWIQYRALVEERVCVTNRMTVQRLFESYLFENGYDHNENEDEVDFIFNQFRIIEDTDKICPSGGVIRYEDEKVKCGVHEVGSEDEEDEGPGEEVPWL